MHLLDVLKNAGASTLPQAEAESPRLTVVASDGFVDHSPVLVFLLADHIRKSKRPAGFLCVHHSVQHYTHCLRKIGVNVGRLVQSNQLTFFDIQSEMHSLDIQKHFEEAVAKLPKDALLFIDDLSTLLCNEQLTLARISLFIHELLSKMSLVIGFLFADSDDTVIQAFNHMTRSASLHLHLRTLPSGYLKNTDGEVIRFNFFFLHSI